MISRARLLTMIVERSLSNIYQDFFRMASNLNGSQIDWQRTNIIMEIKRSEKLALNNSSSNVNGPQEYAARDLTKNGEIAHISLQEKMYTLRITRAGKLILTK